MMENKEALKLQILNVVWREITDTGNLYVTTICQKLSYKQLKIKTHLWEMLTPCIANNISVKFRGLHTQYVLLKKKAIRKKTVIYKFSYLSETIEHCYLAKYGNM
jgi:hypothetical protein